MGNYKQIKALYFIIDSVVELFELSPRKLRQSETQLSFNFISYHVNLHINNSIYAVLLGLHNISKFHKVGVSMV